MRAASDGGMAQRAWDGMRRRRNEAPLETLVLVDS